MKAGPVFAMIGLLLVGLWLVLQPTLNRGSFDFEVRVGSMEMRAERVEGERDGPAVYRFVEPAELAELGELSAEDVTRAINAEVEAWRARPAFERVTLGFLNITSWGNGLWVAIGLIGQVLFFGRMLIQWVISEKSRRSQVPELFWWFSFFGGAMLFTYFVWRVDVVGVLGQSTGVVIYARNLRLIMKQKRRDRRDAARAAEVEHTTHTMAAPEQTTQNVSRPATGG